jgi:SAM-dependent methyltransferase
MPSDQDQRDFAFLRANAQEGVRKGLPFFLHMDQPIGIWNYIRIANDIARQLPAGAHVLDWGCGMGQMTYLMRQRGLRVTSYDVREPGDELPDTPLSREFHRIVSQEPTHLPFDSGVFDAVLSCGVLEHIDEYSQPGNENLSLREIHRVLAGSGTFLIYQLPQRDAWQEAVIRRLKLGYAHPRRYTEQEIRRMLTGAGFARATVRRANLIPKNLTGFPGVVRRVYGRVGRPLIAIDGVISQAPLIRHAAGVMEIAAQRA